MTNRYQALKAKDKPPEGYKSWVDYATTHQHAGTECWKCIARKKAMKEYGDAVSAATMFSMTLNEVRSALGVKPGTEEAGWLMHEEVTKLKDHITGLEQRQEDDETSIHNLAAMVNDKIRQLEKADKAAQSLRNAIGRLGA